MEAHVNEAFIPSTRTAGLPSQAQCLTWYYQATGWNFRADIEWGHIFAAFRNGVIMQGIAARYARRQASSERARDIGDMMGPYGEFTWGLVTRFEGSRDAKLAKL